MSSSNEGFSLVEVVLALGLFAFCIVAITGLLSVGLVSTRSVVNEAGAINIAGSVFGAWEAQDDGASQLTVPGLFSNLPPLTVSGSNTFFFDQSGVQVASSQQAAFQMGYVVSALAATPEVNTRVELFFRWPVGVATNNLQSRYFSRVFVK